MLVSEFIELKLPAGTKVKYEEVEYIYLGITDDSEVSDKFNLDKERTYLQLAVLNKGEYSAKTRTISDYYFDVEIEVINYPAIFRTVPIFKVKDTVYLAFGSNVAEGIVVRAADDDNIYGVYFQEFETTAYIPEEDLFATEEEAIDNIVIPDNDIAEILIVDKEPKES